MAQGTVLDFTIPALNVSVDALKATISGFGDTPLVCDVVAQVEMSVAEAKQMFLFQSDAIDINDVIGSDLRYRLEYTPSTQTNDDGVPDVVMSSGLIANAICNATDNNDHVYEVGTSGATNKAVPHDYLRFLAYKLFRTHLGVDLFDNETAVREALDVSARSALNQKLVDIAGLSSGSWLDASACAELAQDASFNAIHPTYSIVQKMINSDPIRFSDMSANFVAGDATGDENATPAPYFYAPFIAGDSLQFRLLVKAESTQNSVVNDNTINFEGTADAQGRTYRLKIVLTA